MVSAVEFTSSDVRLLTLAAESWDRAQQAREILAKDGLMSTSVRGVVVVHPAVAIERDSRIAFARLLKQLDLDVQAPR